MKDKIISIFNIRNISVQLRLIVLLIILVLATLVRFYKLDKVPPSLNWDEMAAGYNGFTIANWGADEYGNKYPIIFKSFGDDKHPVHIYLTALVVKIFGLSDFSTRASSAAIGVLAILAIYLLVKELSKSELIALLSSLFLAVSPYHIHYSRGLWEANFALSFLIFGLSSFYIGLRKNNWLIPLSFSFFGLSFFSYHSAKIIVPIIVFLVCLFNLKKLLSNKKILIWSTLVVFIFAGLILKEPRILGFARINQTKFSSEVLNKYGGELNTIIHNYKEYFTYSYLFQNGDQSSRASVKVVGEFYKIDLPLMLIGLFALLLRKKWQALIILITWLVLSPIPGAVSALEPSATRGIFIIAPIILLSAIGASGLILFFKNKWIRILITLLVLLFLGREVVNYTSYYFTKYAEKEAIEWQYGMKQIVEYVSENPDYYRVYMDKIRQQPYIFFLYYLKTPLPEFLSSVKYDETESKSYNTVLFFDRYQFGDWDIIGSYPNNNILYVITPSYYGGLRYLQQFDVKKLVKYPNKNDAFYMVSGYE
ncbi:MAG: glycosyltransferase family 39 protein [bacterium]|nr:glycosyltransferase family 39 protein [bacterium]